MIGDFVAEHAEKAQSFAELDASCSPMALRDSASPLRSGAPLRSIILTITLLLSLTSTAQVSSGRIDDMPNLPQPYEMRDWKAVARGADSLMFDANADGDFLPLVRYRRPYNGRRLTDSIFGVPSYVGDQRGEGLEGILTLPSVVSGLLVGIDKRNQGPNNVDYVRMTQDWFSRRDAENVYLNLPLTSTGNDWWYETMPNVFFQHIYSLAGPYGDAEVHFGQLADQWTKVVTALGGSATPWTPGEFNYRSFRIRDLEPVEGGVPEPEAAGAIAYILENAWRETGDVRYRYAAEQALEYLNGLDENPRYELQLYWGVQAAARLNAVERTSYNINKMLGWTLSKGKLRQWGVSITEAGGYDLHGLVGESERGNDYVFYMNGAQAVAALAPVARYDNRMARTIGKYILNVANNSRLFFSPYLPAENQDSYDWASTYDPNGYLAYEAIRERLNGQSPFATGDAIRLNWAPTNIGLYGSAHTGYLAAVVDTTDVKGILELNLNATDFLGPPSYPTRLYYNPYDSAVTVTARRPAGMDSVALDVYEAVRSEFFARNLAGDYPLELAGGQAAVLTWVPTGGEEGVNPQSVTIDGIAIDYSTNRGPREGSVRIKAAAFSADSVARGGTVQLHLATDYAGAEPNWSLPNLSGLPFSIESFRRLDSARAVYTLRATDQLGSFKVDVGLAHGLITAVPDTASAVIRIVPMISGLRDASTLLTAAAFPNPTTGPLSLKLAPGSYEITAADILGRRHILGRYESNSSAIDLNLSALPVGTYTLLATNTQTGRRYASRVLLSP